MIFENQLIFYPRKYPRGDWTHGAEIEDISLVAADGTALGGWFLPAAVPTSSALLFLQGNGGNITERRSLLQALACAPTNVFALDYRGYGRSQGRPSEHGVYQDADAAWRFLTETRQFAPSRIVLFGDSLGGAVAIDLARRVHPAGLIVQSSFTSMPDMARHVLLVLPRVCVRSQFDSLAKINQISCPKLFVHSHDDGMVPYRMGRRLYEASCAPKQFYEIRDAAHNDTLQVGGQAYVSALHHFIHQCVPPKESP